MTAHFKLDGAPAGGAQARQLIVCTFANERDVERATVHAMTWPEVVAMHESRSVRPGKSGQVFCGYAVIDGGGRYNEHVLYRSVIQLDIDSTGEKDKSTGRLLTVKKQAPALEEIRSAIDGFEWVPVSSHWHEPSRGVLKYRVLMLPDRDITPDEHKPVLEALDALLGGALDRDAWNLSQGFYLPSCPAESEHEAFFVRNFGAPLPVDEFVRRGREIMAATEAALAASRKTRAGAGTGNLAKSAPPVEEMRAMLRRLASGGCFEPRTGVESDENGHIVKIGRINAGMALKLAYGEDAGFDLWSELPIGDMRPDPAKQWEGFADEVEPGHTTIATIIRAATDAGFRRSAPGVARIVSEDGSSAAAEVIGAEQVDGFGGDVENGRLFADLFRGRLLHIHETGEWLTFDHVRGWTAAAPGEADRAGKEALVGMSSVAWQRWAVAPEEPKTKRLMAHVERTSRAPNLRAMIDMAKSEPGMTVRLSEFDADPWLLGVANGVLDLRTGALLPMSPEVLVSKRCNVAFDPAATCPRFVQFLREVQPEKEMAFFLLRLMGYCLTGEVSLQTFGFFYGLGANGKSVFIELLAWLLGDYARKISTDMLMHHQRNPQGPSPDIVALKGVRLAFANETEEGRRLAEARVKDLTGGDTLTGRVPYGKADITFQPSHKLFVVGNHKPDITDTSFGMWRRVMLIPFDQTIPEERRDPKLLETLKAEGSGILNALLLGLREYCGNGLPTPAKIKAAVASYREEQDIIGEWVAECCEASDAAKSPKGHLYASYEIWAKTNGHRPCSQSKLTRKLNEKGYRLAADRRTVIGLSLRSAGLGLRPL